MTGKVWTTLKDRNLALGPDRRGGKRWDNWSLTTDENTLAWLLLDCTASSVNTLSGAVLEELDEALEDIESEPPKGLVIRSAKPSGFAAGADVSEFRNLADQEDVKQRLERAHHIVDRLQDLDLPTVAVIHGHCLGGGLELALACDRCIAVEGATFGFPEVKLGLHPGLAGTARATHLIDPTEAMTLMLTGKTLDARKAVSLGLIDAVTEERHVKNAVKAAVEGELPGATRRIKEAALNSAPARKVAANRMRSKTAEKASIDHYPAPYALIDLWEEHGGDRDTMKAAEIPSFAELLVGETAQNLIRVFFLRENLKKLSGEARAFRHIHVAGAGAMGGDIAGWCAFQGLRVTLSDIEQSALAAAVKDLSRLCGQRHLQGAAARQALDNLIPDPKALGVGHADVVIEAVPENLEIKREVYRDLEPRLKQGAILASNTSSIPLEELRSTLEDPSRLVGLHFFNPVAKMELVEVVGHDAADDRTLEAARAFVGRLDRLPAPVASAPGFLVNRALTPYLLEAITMVHEGAKPETVDRAAERFGMPMGPVELADRVGLDICLSVADMLSDRLERPLPKIPDRLREMIESGDRGKKAGKGFYVWMEDGPKKQEDPEEPDEDTTDRLILPMLDACVGCLCEEVVADQDVLDGAMVFATGFAPFRGGPMHYVRSRGVPDIKTRLKDLAGQYGDRFQPHPGWDNLR